MRREKTIYISIYICMLLYSKQTMEEAAKNKPPSGDTHTRVQVSNNKRKLSLSGDDDTEIYNSYFKIRALVRQLRPHFIQVLQTPDFRNCKAAHEIREKLKLVSDLYKNMIVERDAPVDLVTQQQQTVSGESDFREKASASASDQLKEGKEAELLKTDHSVKKPTADMKCRIPSSCSEPKLNGGKLRGSYVVGGSVGRWNFITYGGSKPVYYGPSKDSYLSRKIKSYSPHRR